MSETVRRFLEKIDYTGDCWEWTAYKVKQGYGRFRYQQYPHYAHRMSYRLFVASIPDGNVVLHTCDNPSCVKPSHLFSTSQKRNIKDASEKGRRNSESYATSLTRAQVEKIRQLYKTGEHKQVKLANRFDVSQQTISRIVNHVIWSDNNERKAS